MKICYKCQTEKPITEFRKGRPGKRQSYCSDCHKEYQRSYYQANKDKARANAKKRRNKHRKTIRALKEVPCTDCQKSYPYYVMDFDHVSGSKIAGISEMVTNAVKGETLHKEISKCEVVCANCHRERTHTRKTLP